MRKVLSVLISTLVLIVCIPVIAVACSNGSSIYGTVYFNSNPVGRNIKVTITCNGHTLTTKTDRHGNYQIDFQSNKCRRNTTVTVSATYNGNTGSNSVKLRNCKTRLNVYIEYATVPEFGNLTTIAALCISSFGFVSIRRIKNKHYT